MDIFPEKTSVQIVEEYYLNNRQMFFDYMDEHVIWMGPATEQYIEGKEQLLHAFEKENNNLQFRTAQMSSKYISGGTAATCEVLLKFVVYTYYPSGYVDVRNQRITIFWKKVKLEDEKVWRFAMIHISNSGDMDSRDNIYPIHLDEFEEQLHSYNLEDFTKRQQNRFIAKGEDYSTHYIDYNDILYISGGKGKFSDIYTRHGIIRVRLLIDQIEKKLPKQFYRPHRSHLVNVFEIINIVRYKITLRNNVEIPIPEKKFKTVSNDINRLISEFQK